MRKPTPAQLADMIGEDQNGLPIDTNQTNDNSGMDNNVSGETTTTMQQCAAVSCAHNDAGGCVLDSIDINDRGGCEQYEACADDSVGDDDGRYDEQETDISGTNSPATSRSMSPGQPAPGSGITSQLR